MASEITVQPSGGDDTAALASAVQSVGSGGQVSLVAGATYNVTPSATGALQPADQVTIEGIRATLKVAANPPTGNTKIFGVQDNHSLYLHDLILQGPSSWQSAADSVFGAGPTGNNQAPNEVVFRDCQALGLNFAANFGQGIRRRLCWIGGLIDGQSIGTTQNTCSGLLGGNNSSVGATLFGGVEVYGGTVFRNLGSSVAAGRSLSHAIYVGDWSYLLINGAFFFDLLYGEVITHHTSPNSTKPADAQWPFDLIQNVYIQGGASGFVGVQCDYWGDIEISNCVIDHQTPIQVRGGVTKVSNTALRNNFSGVTSGGLVQWNVPSGIGEGPATVKLTNCDFDCTNANFESGLCLSLPRFQAGSGYSADSLVSVL